MKGKEKLDSCCIQKQVNSSTSPIKIC